ncbi:MAG: RNA degradosome polyphosphate kinase, partial [Victivallales bacterium]
MKSEKQKNQIQFLNRDISWLEFNARVLDEAADKGNPLLERLKFIAIFSSNLDEFFMVRIAGITSQLDTKFHRIYKEYGYEPAELLAELDRRIKELVARQYRYLNNDILPELRKHKITIAAWDSLTTLQKNTALKIMTTEIYPVLTPIGIDQSHPFPLV